MSDQTSDQEKTEMLKAWDSLSPKGRERLLEEAEVIAELDSPDHQERAQAHEETYRLQMASVSALKTQLMKISQDVHNVINSCLPKGELTNLLVTQELLSFLVFAAEYKPFYYFESDGATFLLAKKMLRSVPLQLKKLERGKA